MKRRKVNSATFLSAGYDAEHHILETEFRHGGVYRYFDVPPGVWTRFIATLSKGRFFARYIRTHYLFRKID